MTSEYHKGKHSGPWSKADKNFIENNYRTMSADQIAARLRKNEEAVAKYIRKTYGSNFHATAKNAEYDIKQSPMWDDLKRQFTADELKKFMYHWGRIISQFKDDVYPTEQMQVIDCVKLDLLMNRALTQQHDCLLEVKSCENLLEIERSKDRSDQDRDLIFGLEKQIGILRAANEALNRDYMDMLQKKNSILKEMKATRDARIKSVESYKQSFGGWLIRIMENRGVRTQVGEDMEKMRLAMDSEYMRLSEFHEYMDGQVDQPILNHENVIED